MKRCRCCDSMVLAMVLFLLLAGCAVNPATGQHQIMLLSEQEEARLGQSTDQSVVEQYGVYNDPGLQNYLQSLGQVLGRNSHRPDLNWRFKVMDTPVVNAFAAPGGYIYVTRGLLAAVNNEAELAGVLGHEIGHDTARHSAQQYSNMMLTNLGLSLGQGLLGGYGDMLGPILQSGARLLFLKFSRDDEREADVLGVEYATRAGYDAGRMADFFITLQHQPGSGGEQAARLPEFFSTHPNPVNREATVRALVGSWQARIPSQQFRVNRAALLGHLEGLVYGEDPRQGFRQGDWYYLPQYQVKLPIPEGWKVEREGKVLQLSHPQGKALALLNIRPGSNTRQVVEEFVKSTGVEVQQDISLNLAGMPARRLLSILSNGQQRAVVVSHFYQRGPDVFAFHGMTGQAGYAAMSEPMQRPAKGFAAMTDPARLNIQPKRITIKVVAAPTSLEKLLLTMKVDRELWAETAWINGRQLADVLTAGEQVKVIR